MKLRVRTQAELDAYNASIMYQSKQARYQNPEYTQDYFDYFTIYYDIMLKHLLVGTESYVTILSMFPGGELYDVSKFLYDLSEYKKGDEAKIVADLVALGIDVAAEFADEIIDAAKMAKKVAAKKAAKIITKHLDDARAVGITNTDVLSKMSQNITDAFAQGRKFTEPELPIGGHPKGKYGVPDVNDPGPIMRQNNSADILAHQGFDIEMLPERIGGNGYGVKQNSNPDFLINGVAFDCYSPETANVRNIWSTVEKKTKSQARNIILNLDAYPGSLDDLAIEFLEYPISSLKELFIIKNGRISRLIIN